MRKIAILIIINTLLSCHKEKIHINTEENNSIISTSEIHISQIENEPYYKLNINEVINPYGGIVYISFITNDVNVHLLPQFDSRIIDELNTGTSIRIIGISNIIESLENNDLYWVKIHYGEGEYFNINPKIGWILSSFTRIDRCCISNLEIVKMEITNFSSKYYRFKLHGTYNINSQIMDFSVYANKLDNQDFFTFTWDHTSVGFHYSNKPGLYIWNENQKELRHISYIGGQGSKWGNSHWSVVTDDFKYLLQDQGTAPPPRIVVIWDLEYGEEISFSENIENLIYYYEDINLKGYIIEILKYFNIYYDGKWHTRNSNMTDEEIKFAEIFIKENDPPQDLIDYGCFSFQIVYEYNIETKKEKIIGGQYIFEQ
jgi:hypothetical protein